MALSLGVPNGEYMQMLNEIQPDLAEKAMLNYAEGTPIYQTLGIEEKALEAAYLVAYNNYIAGNYKEAETMFSMLTLYNTTDARFSMGLGSARQAREKFLEAIDAYSIAAVISDMQDPTPQYYAAICMIKLGKPKEAIATLEVALQSKKLGEFEHLKSMCEDLLIALKAG